MIIDVGPASNYFPVYITSENGMYFKDMNIQSSMLDSPFYNIPVTLIIDGDLLIISKEPEIVDILDADTVSFPIFQKTYKTDAQAKDDILQEAAYLESFFAANLHVELFNIYSLTYAIKVIAATYNRAKIFNYLDKVMGVKIEYSSGTVIDGLSTGSFYQFDYLGATVTLYFNQVADLISIIDGVPSYSDDEETVSQVTSVNDYQYTMHVLNALGIAYSDVNITDIGGKTYIGGLLAHNLIYDYVVLRMVENITNIVIEPLEGYIIGGVGDKVKTLLNYSRRFPTNILSLDTKTHLAEKDSTLTESPDQTEAKAAFSSWLDELFETKDSFNWRSDDEYIYKLSFANSNDTSVPRALVELALYSKGFSVDEDIIVNTQKRFNIDVDASIQEKEDVYDNKNDSYLLGDLVSIPIEHVKRYLKSRASKENDNVPKIASNIYSWSIVQELLPYRIPEILNIDGNTISYRSYNNFARLRFEAMRSGYPETNNFSIHFPKDFQGLRTAVDGFLGLPIVGGYPINGINYSSIDDYLQIPIKLNFFNSYPQKYKVADGFKFTLNSTVALTRLTIWHLPTDDVSENEAILGFRLPFTHTDTGTLPWQSATYEKENWESEVGPDALIPNYGRNIVGGNNACPFSNTQVDKNVWDTDVSKYTLEDELFYSDLAAMENSLNDEELQIYNNSNLTITDPSEFNIENAPNNVVLFKDVKWFNCDYPIPDLIEESGRPSGYVNLFNLDTRFVTINNKTYYLSTEKTMYYNGDTYLYPTAGDLIIDIRFESKFTLLNNGTIVEPYAVDGSVYFTLPTGDLSGVRLYFTKLPDSIRVFNKLRLAIPGDLAIDTLVFYKGAYIPMIYYVNWCLSKNITPVLSGDMDPTELNMLNEWLTSELKEDVSIKLTSALSDTTEDYKEKTTLKALSIRDIRTLVNTLQDNKTNSSIHRLLSLILSS